MKLKLSKKHIAGSMALGLAMTGLAAAPASASDDEETEFSDSFTFTAENPCSGEEHSITIAIEGEERDRGDRIDVRIERTGTTSDGYVLEDGEERLRVEGDEVVRARLKDVWNRADGSRFTAEGRFRVDTDSGEVLVDEFSLTCND